jgi:hypothetical protein
MDWLIWIIPAVLLYRVFSKSVPYAGVSRKTKILHALAILFLFYFFFDVPAWVFWLIQWPGNTVRAEFVTIGFFPPVFSLLIFCAHVIAGLFVIRCAFALAGGVDKWRKRLVKMFPVLVLVIAFDGLIDSQGGDVPTPAIVIFLLLFGYVLMMIYLFYSRPYSDALFDRRSQKSSVA